MVHPRSQSYFIPGRYRDDIAGAKIRQQRDFLDIGTLSWLNIKIEKLEPPGNSYRENGAAFPTMKA